MVTLMGFLSVALIVVLTISIAVWPLMVSSIDQLRAILLFFFMVLLKVSLMVPFTVY